VVVDDFCVGYFAVLPHKTHSPLLIDADAMLTLAVALERLELVAGRHSQIAESCRRIEVLKLRARPLLYLSVETLDEFAAECRFRPIVRERSTLPTCGSGAGVADLSLQLMGSLIVVEVPEFFAPIVGVRVGAQQIVGSQQQPVRVARAEAGVPVSSRTLHLHPHSQHRAAVTPAQRGRGAPRPQASDADPAKVSTPRHVAMSWARRLKRVFDVEIESCTRCGGELKIIASLEEPQLMAKILAHLERTAPEQSQSELPLRKRGPPAQSSLL
jgi:hypothetical protein